MTEAASTPPAADVLRCGVRTACPYCGVGCGVIATPDGQGGAAIDGDPDHPANFGRLCSKGSALGETVGLDGRLLTPMVGGLEASWDEATTLVARRFREAIDQHGPDSVAFYVSGQLLTEDYYVANKLMKGFIGSANIDTNSRLCMASSVAGHKRAFGADTVPGTYEDLEEADLVVLVGSNLAWCHPVLFQRIAAAKAARPGMRVVNIDPRRTATSGLADLSLSLAPGSDVALFNALLSRIVEEGAVDDAYVRQHVAGFPEAVARAQAVSPAEVAAVTGLREAEIEAFTHLWIGSERVVTVYSQGVNQSSAGTDKVNAIINCHLATGRIGRPGMGPFSVTGQPNAMGGREVGGLATMLAAHLDVTEPAHRDAVQDFWQAPAMPTAPGLKAVDLFRACADGRIKALWIMSTNPAVSLPQADDVAAAIRACPFVVVSDILADTDTTRLADVLLPAAGWGEKSGTVTNSERRISRQRAFLPAPFNARPDWRIVADV
ncbi:MAG: molybdopterin-dependent oxidoreductase, partial [Pseudomonadota bacterium]